MKKTFWIVMTMVSTLSVRAQTALNSFKTPFTRYPVNTASCVQIDHTSGTKIFIENDAFVTANPDVEIRYREFTTPLDMLVNNIPMTTEHEGKTHQLASGGMFEIKAMQNGKELSMRDGKRIEVQFAIDPDDHQASKMKAFNISGNGEKWELLPALVRNQSVGNDEKEWGSTGVREEAAEFQEEWGWGESFGVMEQNPVQKVAFQAMEIDEMGFYNYDYIIEDEEFVPMVANFEINGQPVTSTVYVVYDGLNTVFYYPPYTWEEQFSLINGRAYRLFTIDAEGRVAQLQYFPDLSEMPDAWTFELISELQLPETKTALAQQLKL